MYKRQEHDYTREEIAQGIENAAKAYGVCGLEDIYKIDWKDGIISVSYTHLDVYKRQPLTVHGYGLMIGIGVLAAYLTAEYRAKKKGLDNECIFWIVVWGLLGGLLGAKLLYYITEIKTIVANPRLLLNVTDGFVVYGGIIGGFAAAYIYLRWKKYEPIKYYDMAMPSLSLIHI